MSTPDALHHLQYNIHIFIHVQVMCSGVSQIIRAALLTKFGKYPSLMWMELRLENTNDQLDEIRGDLHKIYFDQSNLWEISKF